MTDSKPAWMVVSNTDLTEGRGHAFPLHICEVEATANRLAKGAFVMGSNAPVEPVMLMSVGGCWLGPVKVVPPSTEDAVAQRALDARRDAITKAKAAGLTDDEIAAIRR